MWRIEITHVCVDDSASEPRGTDGRTGPANAAALAPDSTVERNVVNHHKYMRKKTFTTHEHEPLDGLVDELVVVLVPVPVPVPVPEPVEGEPVPTVMDAEPEDP